MPTTIDHQLSLNRDLAPRTGGHTSLSENEPGQSAATASGSTQPSTADVRVDVQRASRLYEAEAKSSSGNIQNREQAESVLTRLKDLFGQQPDSALQSFRNPGASVLSSLLNPP